MLPFSAAQIRAAVSSSVSSSDPSSVSERLITFSTSLVAVWYSSDSCKSRERSQFVENPCILDRDHRLVGEGAHQLDLPVGERLDPPTIERDDADRLPPTQQWHAKCGVNLTNRNDSRPLVFRVG